MVRLVRDRSVNRQFQPRLATPSGWVDVRMEDGREVAEVEGSGAVAALTVAGFRVEHVTPAASIPPVDGPDGGQPGAGSDPNAGVAGGGKGRDGWVEAIRTAIEGGSNVDEIDQLADDARAEAEELGWSFEVADHDGLVAVEAAGKNRKGVKIALAVLLGG